jgi:hypothetical protein
MQTLFNYLITLQFLVVVLHDWLDIPGWTHGRQVQSTIGRKQLWIATAINAIFPGLAVAFALWYWNAPKPAIVVDYWLIYCAITLGSAITMWYVPYFFGASQRKTRDYAQMYAGTRQVLPRRGDNPRPNLLHVCFHVLFVINLALAIALRF